MLNDRAAGGGRGVAETTPTWCVQPWLLSVSAPSAVTAYLLELCVPVAGVAGVLCHPDCPDLRCGRPSMLLSVCLFAACLAAA